LDGMHAHELVFVGSRASIKTERHGTMPYLRGRTVRFVVTSVASLSDAAGCDFLVGTRPIKAPHPTQSATAYFRCIYLVAAPMNMTGTGLQLLARTR
jgi:hypothetical protein